MANRYFFKITNENKTNNKLEEAVLEFIKENDRQIVHQTWVDKFKDALDEVIDLISSKYPRCKPSCVDFKWSSSIKDDELLYIGDFLTVRFYLIAGSRKEVGDEE
ncbi:hypothetical protein GCM10011514_06190 [Emticicia aquatilis]|uniref:Uncharacterized protein n=1 Tax=Emticicia aquatilis TaxID=1537369 RepID=A0A916YHF8_9BACT|nr:hypothetical protein [Emticicia aquatilis]GGD44931.1 hypothetical protein GCM10011514_06190 [Emticicia aquatilis]